MCVFSFFAHRGEHFLPMLFFFSFFFFFCFFFNDAHAAQTNSALFQCLFFSFPQKVHWEFKLRPNISDLCHSLQGWYILSDLCLCKISFQTGYSLIVHARGIGIFIHYLSVLFFFNEICDNFCAILLYFEGGSDRSSQVILTAFSLVHPLKKYSLVWAHTIPSNLNKATTYLINSALFFFFFLVILSPTLPCEECQENCQNWRFFFLRFSLFTWMYKVLFSRK